MALSESARDASPDDGIRVRGDDALFGDEPHDVPSVCRPAPHGHAHTHRSSSSSSSSISSAHQCQCQPSAAESREFRKRWMLLTDAERTASLRADSLQFLQTVNELLPCLGCRGGTEALFQQLMSGSCVPPPLVVHSGLSFDNEKHFRLSNGHMSNSDASLALFLHHERWGNSALAKYSRTSKASTARGRCPLHSQRARGRPRPAAFEALWHKLPEDEQRHLVHIDSEQFLTDLENYLRRHRFCCRCKEKVLEAYDLLIGSSCSEDDCEDCAGFDCGDRHHDRGDYGDELHYTSYLFDELTYSRATNHIVVPCHIDYLSQLMTRADQEIVGDWGDRHARTIAEAQDEVLTCLGIVIWEKMQNLWTRSRTEKRSEELLVHCAVATLRRNFDVAVEALHGKEMMEQLLAEEDDETRRLAKKKEKRKEKKKKRKQNATKQKGSSDKPATPSSSSDKRNASSATANNASGSKKKLAPSSSSSSAKTLSMSELSSPTHSMTSSQDGENQSDSESDDDDQSESAAHHCSTACDDACTLKQLPLDEQVEMQLLSSMGWNGSDRFGSSFPESDDDTDDENQGIPEDEIEFWNRNRSALASKRLAQRQQLQEKFDQFVLRSNSLADA